MRIDPQRADALAAQYVLGTLRGRARDRVERLSRRDAVMNAAVAAWEQRLLPFAESVSPVEPPARVWERVLARIQGGRATSTPQRSPSLWASLALWRGLALAGFVTALALVVVLTAPPRERPDQTLVAVLAGADAKPVMIASVDSTGRVMRVRTVAPVDVAPDRSLELWALPQGANPRSLGLIAPGAVVEVPLAAPAASALAQVPALAISLEPRGGSPTGLPTGPVLYSGPIQRMF